MVVSAQDPDTTSNQYRTETESQYGQDAQTQSQYQQDRQRIQSTELPEEVKRTLEGEEYRGWLVSGAYKAKAAETNGMNGEGNTTPDVNRQPSPNVMGQEDEEIYIVELQNGAETQTLRFDKDGNKLEDQSGQGMGDQYNQNGQGDQNGQYNQNGQSDQYNQNDQGDRSNQYNDQSQQNSQYNEGDAGQQSEQADPNATEQSEDWSRESSGQPSQGDIESPDQSTQSTESQSTESQSSQSADSPDQSHVTEQR